MIIRLFLVALSLFAVPAPLFAEPAAVDEGPTSLPDGRPTLPPSLPSLLFAQRDDGAAADRSGQGADAEARKALRDLSPEVLEKLTPADIVEVLRQREITKRDNLRRGEPPAVAILVPVAFFLMVVGVVGLILRFRVSRHEKLHETMQRMIEKGVEIPPALILPPVGRDGDLRKGLIWSGVGLSSANALYLLAPAGSWSLGLIPLFVGLGYLVVWRYARGRAES